MSELAVVSAEDANRAVEIAMAHRNRLVEEISQVFPGREAQILCIALAGLFASSMTSDADQQSGQAQMLNETLSRWASHRIPWRLVPEQ